MSGRKSLYVSKNSVKNLRCYVFCYCCCIVMSSLVVYTLWYLGSLYPIKTSHHIFSILFLYALLVALFYVPFWLYYYLFFICLFYICVCIYVCVFLLCSIKSIKSYLCLTLLHDIVLVALLWFIISGCIVIFCLFVRFIKIVRIYQPCFFMSDQKHIPDPLPIRPAEHKFKAAVPEHQFLDFYSRKLLIRKRFIWERFY